MTDKQEQYWNKIVIINKDGEREEREFVDLDGREMTTKNTIFTKDTPLPQTIGGLNKGTSYKDKTVKEILEQLLYPYVSFSVSSISVSDSPGTFEIGTTKYIRNVTVNITQGSNPITSIELRNNSGITIGKKESEDGITDFEFTFDPPISTTTNYYVSAIVEDSANTVKTGTSSQFTFVYPYYYGAIDDGVELTETLIKSLTKQVVSKGTKSYTITMTKQKAVFSYPSSYGNIAKILDANNFNVTDTFIKNTLTINGISYYVYVLSSPTTATMKYTFSY